MNNKDNIREIDMDEVRDKVDDSTSEVVDETLNDMLRFVQHYESKEDYWFVKYYEAACFCVFTLGCTANLFGNRFWINPNEPEDPKRKKKVLKFLSFLISKDIWSTFKGREDLAYRIFAYGTHYVREKD